MGVTWLPSNQELMDQAQQHVYHQLKEYLNILVR